MEEEPYDESNVTLEEFYSEDSIHELMEDDEIHASEDGFMLGYLNA